ncbi:MAG: terminase large subunit domain-containing protein [Microcoleus sp.]
MQSSNVFPTLTRPQAAFELLPYQKKCFLDRSRFKLLMWARGCRKTSTVTLEIVDDCFSQEAQGRRTTWVILSRGERQAREALEEAKRHCRAYTIAAGEIQESVFVSKDGSAEYKQFQIDFPLGSRIIALPANPDTARGYTANVFLDEFCIHDRDKEIWQALFPVLRGRMRLIVSSTPKGGKSRKFYELVTGDSEAWSRHIVDIYDAVKQGLPFDIEVEREVMADPDGWFQEFELGWLDDAGPWLDWDLIDGAEHPEAGIPGKYQSGPCFLGNDIGRVKDLWVAWVVEQVGDVLWTREIVSLRNRPFAEHDAEFERLFQKYRIVRACMDQTGIGQKPVEDAIRRYGELRVEGITFSAPAKTDMANVAKKRFQDKRIRIPQGDRVLRADLHSLRKLMTPAGNVRFDVSDEDGMDSNSHADYAWACFLACYAASNPSAPIAFEAAPSLLAQYHSDFVGAGSSGGYGGYQNDFDGFLGGY